MASQYLLICSIFLQISIVLARSNEGQCVALGVELCRNLNYNHTLIPNVKMNIDTMYEASQRLSEFSPLFKIKCYANFQFFVCNMFVPICQTINGNPTPVYPCRHVCEAARAGCAPLMKKYKFDWPDILNCEFLSRIDDPNALCGSPPDVRPSRKTTTTQIRPTIIPGGVVPKVIDRSLNKPKNWAQILKLLGLDPKTPYSKKTLCSFYPDFVYVKKENKEYCPSKCDNPQPFSKQDLSFASVWIAIWSIICFLSTAVTVSTFLIDHARFKYPERPIIFLSFCYNLFSIGYLIRVFGGYNNVVCEQSENGSHIVIEGMSVTSCTLVFFFLYFFGMASALWWVILSVTWFLSAALKWGHEAIEKYATIFHAISWFVPTIQTIIALVTKRVHAEKLSGLCYVGSQSSRDLLLFAALPLLIYLLIGTVFLCMGFIALIKIRKILRKERNTNKFERLMLRIGVFSFLYSVPASIVVGCLIHEYNRLKLVERNDREGIICTTSHCAEETNPKAELLYLRYFMSLVVGVTSGVWIWTSKTFNSWIKFYHRHACLKDRSEERKQLYQSKQKPSFHSDAKKRKASHDNENQTLSPPNSAALMPNVLGSNGNVTQQQVFVSTQPTQFFYPVTHHPASYMQAHNVPISQTQLDGRGYNITPISNLTMSDTDNIVSPYTASDSAVMSHKNYSRTSSDHYSVSQSSQNNGTLTRIEQPGSPKSQSTRSQRSSEDRRL